MHSLTQFMIKVYKTRELEFITFRTSFVFHRNSQFVHVQELKVTIVISEAFQAVQENLVKVFLHIV